MSKNPFFSTKQFSDTNVEEVKKLNAQSGLSYNEVFALLAEQYNNRQGDNKN